VGEALAEALEVSAEGSVEALEVSAVAWSAEAAWVEEPCRVD
jgi:hypothetical protein